MTDMVTGSNQGQDTGAVSQPVSTPSQASQQAPVNDERLFKQSEVTDIVKRERNEAVERYRRMSIEQPQYVQQKYGDAQTIQQAPYSQSQQPISPDDFRRMAAEEAQRLMDKRQEDATRSAQEQDAQRIAAEFFTKLSTGREKFQDFDTVMGDMDFGKIGNTVQLARGFDNVAEMMYHLRKNPEKMVEIEQLTYFNPKYAYEKLTSLSNAIKQNDQAGNVRLPNEPLSQLRPSNTGTDSGVLGIRDYKAKYRG